MTICLRTQRQCLPQCALGTAPSRLLACTNTHTGWTTVWLRTVWLRLAGLQGRPSRKWRVRTGIQNVAKSLPSHPPSQDALRCYVLPLYKDFTDPKQTAKLQTPYAEGVLKLGKEMAEVFKTGVPLCLPCGCCPWSTV
ncbi:uncharacterized protein LOC135101166 isoform X3 [Scylla paramamosain]|uniref:uncharacterized protein LOC135101166 isoform X3 n=1 Tax=Scylla paramamosain TaxID=85552 RepID=UPI003083AF53